MTRLVDQPYVVRGRQALLADLYIPASAPGPLPVIVWLHGGGWRFGDRRVGPDLLRFFASSGFAMASLDYRLTTEAIFPAQIEDVKAGIRWLRAVAPEYNLDSNRIGLWGASSGGHLAALAATSGPGVFETAADPYARYSSAVHAVAVGYPPTDFLQIDAHRDPTGRPSDDPESIELPAHARSADAKSFESRLVGAPIETCPEKVRAANPMTYVKPGLPPFLIVHGLSDTTVPVHQSLLLYEALAAAGNEVTLGLIEGLGHGFLNRSHLDAGAPRRWMVRTSRERHESSSVADQHVFDEVERFFRDHLGGKSS
jgi:acetyl esterase/lipase